MSDLDVIREARDYLAGLVKESTPGPWRAMPYEHNPGDQGVPILGAVGTTIGARLTAYTMTLFDQEQSEVDARLIVALRAAAPFLLGAMDEAIEFWGYLDEPGRALDLARAILATKGQDDD